MSNLNMYTIHLRIDGYTPNKNKDIIRDVRDLWTFNAAYYKTVNDNLQINMIGADTLTLNEGPFSDLAPQFPRTVWDANCGYCYVSMDVVSVDGMCTEFIFDEQAFRLLYMGQQPKANPVQAEEDMTIRQLLDEAYETAKAKGWWDFPRAAGDIFANIHAEVSEAWESYRNGDSWERIWFSGPESAEKPEGIASEFADTIIRIADACKAFNIPIEKALRLKLDYNRTRPYRHGDKKA